LTDVCQNATYQRRVLAVRVALKQKCCKNDYHPNLVEFCLLVKKNPVKLDAAELCDLPKL